MSNNISQFVTGQFPKVYQEEYPLYTEFVKLYYKWLETRPNAIYYNRNFLELIDVDTATDDILLFLKEEYLKNIQFTTESNLRLLIKHSLDIYRSKGTERSIDLLFRIVFNELVDFYYPSEDLFVASDGVWKKPKYIELAISTNNQNFYQKQIIGISSGATAFVDSLIRKTIDNKLHDVAYISSITGFFQTGEKIKIIDDETPSYFGLITGSLNLVVLNSSGSGSGFEIGDIVNIYSNYGVSGKGRVSNTGFNFGEITYTLNDGGYGFTNAPSIYISNSILNINSISVDSIHRTKPFDYYDVITQPLATISYISSNGSFSVGTNVYTYYANNLEKGIGNILSKSEINATNGTLTLSIVSGNLQSNQIFSTSNSIVANTANSGFEDITATGKYIGTKTTQLICNSLSLNGSFSINDYVYINNEEITNDISVRASGYVSNTFSDVANNLIVCLSNTVGIFKNTYTLKSTTSNVKIKNVSLVVGVANVENAFVNTSSAYVYSQFVNGNMYEVQSLGSGTSLTVSNTSFNEEIQVNSDLLSNYASVNLNSSTYGISGNTSGNLTNMTIEQMLSYSNVTIGIIDKISGNPGKNYVVPPLLLIDQENISSYDKYNPILNITGPSTSFTVGEIVTQTATSARGKVISANSTEIVLKQMRFNQDNQFILTINSTTTIIGGTSGSTANVSNVTFEYDYNQMGINALFETSMVDANGSITEIEIVDSGIGYINNEQVWMNKDNLREKRSNTAYGLTSLVTYGTGSGFYQQKGGFLSDQKKIFDGDYYQNFSYEIQSSKSLNKYNDMIKQTTHIAGKKLFGKFIHKKTVDSSITSANTVIEY